MHAVVRHCSQWGGEPRSIDVRRPLLARGTRAHPQVHTHVHTRTNMHTHTRARTRAHTHAHAYPPTHPPTCVATVPSPLLMRRGSRPGLPPLALLPLLLPLLPSPSPSLPSLEEEYCRRIASKGVCGAFRGWRDGMMGGGGCVLGRGVMRGCACRHPGRPPSLPADRQCATPPPHAGRRRRLHGRRSAEAAGHACARARPSLHPQRAGTGSAPPWRTCGP